MDIERINPVERAWVSDQITYWNYDEGVRASKAHRVGRIEGLVTGLMVAHKRAENPFNKAMEVVYTIAEYKGLEDQIFADLPISWRDRWGK